MHSLTHTLIGQEDEGSRILRICLRGLTWWPACTAVRNMVKARDFERRMLFMAVQFTHDGKLRPLLLTVLTALSDTLADSDETSTSEEMDMQASVILRYVPFMSAMHEFSVFALASGVQSALFLRCCRIASRARALVCRLA